MIQQLFVGPRVVDLPVPDDIDLVRIHDGGETMGDDNEGLAFSEL